jgi:Fe-S cluster biogenesis protein NfuA
MNENNNHDIVERVNQALEDIRPHLAVDGGDIEVVDVSDDYVVKIKWIGNCEHCTMSSMTMKAGVEQAIKSKVPEIRSVEAINGVLVS